MKPIFKVSLLILVLLAFTAVKVDNPAKDLFSTAFCNPTNGCTVVAILTHVISIFLSLTGLIAVLFIMIGGYQYLTSGANEELAKTGKKTLTNAIIGLGIVILSYVIVTIVVNAAFGHI
jgi:hypothetical protein